MNRKQGSSGCPLFDEFVIVEDMPQPQPHKPALYAPPLGLAISSQTQWRDSRRGMACQGHGVLVVATDEVCYHWQARVSKLGGSYVKKTWRYVSHAAALLAKHLCMQPLHGCMQEAMHSMRLLHSLSTLTMCKPLMSCTHTRL